MRRLLLLGIGMLLAFPVAALADPGPSDEVVVIPGTCDNPTTIVSAHNTQDRSLGYLIRIDGRIVEEGRLALDERVRRTYTEPLGESHFFRIRLGLPVDHVYFSDEATADLTNCPSESPSTSTTPPPTSSSSSGSSSSSTSSVGGNSGSSPTRGPTVKGESGSRGGTAFTGPENLPWGVAAMILLLLAGSLALRIGSRKLNTEDPER